MLSKTETVIIGSGPAGCAAGLTLSRQGRDCIILDKLDVAGGLARSIKRGQSTFDVGPHRFFTQSPEVIDLWKDCLGNDLISVARQTRIIYRGKLFNYPLSPINALFGLGMKTSFKALFSYLSRKIYLGRFRKDPASFEDWVTDNFGQVLYEAFFKHYTEKVWGIPCSDISVEWASQRIKGLNLPRAVLNALTMHKTSKIKTLVNTFLYPRNGSGMLYEKMVERACNNGCRHIACATVTGLERNNGEWTVIYNLKGSKSESISCQHVLSSMPLNELISMLSPPPPEDVRAAAFILTYRNHYCVNLQVRGHANLFPDNWLYVHSPELSTARIANFANFSQALAGDRNLFPIAVEFFSTTGDGIDTAGNDRRIDLAISELKRLGLLKSSHKVEDAFVVFSKNAYPVIKVGYERSVARIRAYLKQLNGLQTMGRGGLFQYNNQDHSIITGILAARIVLGQSYDVWSVNSDADYHESGTAPDLCHEDRYHPPSIPR
jgi:protoporphyrinogen oxidase